MQPDQNALVLPFQAEDDVLVTRLGRRLFNTPHAITVPKAAEIAYVLGPKLGYHIRGPLGFGGGDRGRSFFPITADGLAIVPIMGTLVKRTSAMEADSGLVSAEALASSLYALGRDDAVRGVLLQIDSDGGEVAGTAEAAAAVRAVSATYGKPIWAIADEYAFSAAYWIASAADRVIVTEGGAVGSVGVIAMHVDQTAQDKADGKKFTFIRSSERKAELNPHEPLSPDARERLQVLVDGHFERFAAAVATNRHLTTAIVRGWNALTFDGQGAVDAQLADETGTFAEALDGLRQAVTRSAQSREARTMADVTTGTPAPTAPAPAAPTNVVAADELERRRAEAHAEGRNQGALEAQAAERARVKAINEFCTLVPDLFNAEGQRIEAAAAIAEFTESGASADVVRETMFARRASAADAGVLQSHVMPGARRNASPAQAIDGDEIIARQRQEAMSYRTPQRS